MAEIQSYLSAEIHYTTVDQAIKQFYADPHGDKIWHFLNQAYGIANPGAILNAAGMEEYLRYKAEGRFIGLFASQILKPSFYNLTSAVILGELAKNGLPAALMVFEYPQDVFNPRNKDKVGLFGNQEFWLDGQNINLNVNPIEADINHLAGTPCGQIMARAEKPLGPGNQPYFDEKTVFLQAALGLDLPNPFNLKDFYKTLWLEAINRLRRNQILPDEATLPMFFVDMVQLYSTLAQATGRKGMMTAAEYYPFQVAWPDLYLEDSGGSGKDFETNIIKAQQKRYQAGLAEVQVRVPYREVPDLDRFCLHPTGRIVDLLSIWTSRNAELQELGKNKQRNQLIAVTAERNQAYFQALNDNLDRFLIEKPITFPSSIAQVYQSIIKGVL